MTEVGDPRPAHRPAPRHRPTGHIQPARSRRTGDGGRDPASHQAHDRRGAGVDGGDDLARARAGAHLLHEFFDVVPALCARAVGAYYAASPTEIPFAPLPFGWKGLSYGMGHFRCAPDEAVILTVRPPNCPYWSFQLMNHQWDALDWHLRQSSLNGHQAVIDDDGILRAVIAHRDPGVSNWLDPAELQVAPFDSVTEHLHPTTAPVSPDERQALLRRRMHSVRRRMCD